MIARETATPEPDHARPEGLSVGRHWPSLATRGCGGASRDRHAGDLLARLISRAAEPFCQEARTVVDHLDACHPTVLDTAVDFDAPGLAEIFRHVRVTHR